MTQVYVLLRGEVGEGGHVIGVYRSKREILTVIANQPRHFPGPWREVTREEWRNGIDTLWISQHEVK